MDYDMKFLRGGDNEIVTLIKTALTTPFITIFYRSLLDTGFLKAPEGTSTVYDHGYRWQVHASDAQADEFAMRLAFEHDFEEGKLAVTKKTSLKDLAYKPGKLSAASSVYSSNPGYHVKKMTHDHWAFGGDASHKWHHKPEPVVYYDKAVSEEAFVSLKNLLYQEQEPLLSIKNYIYDYEKLQGLPKGTVTVKLTYYQDPQLVEIHFSAVVGSKVIEMKHTTGMPVDFMRMLDMLAPPFFDKVVKTIQSLSPWPSDIDDLF